MFRETVSALCHALVEERCLAGAGSAAPEANAVVQFVLAQHARMPDFLKTPLVVLTVVFDLHCVLKHGVPFRRLDCDHRIQHVRDWRLSRLGFRRDFVRLFESLAVLGWHSMKGSRP